MNKGTLLGTIVGIFLLGIGGAWAADTLSEQDITQRLMPQGMVPPQGKLRGIGLEVAPSASERKTVAPAKASSGSAPSIDMHIEFAYDSDVLTPEAMTELDKLGRALSSPALARFAFRLTGHTDASGASEHNIQLSKRRAMAVQLYLVERFGVAPERLKAVGMGSKQPADPSDPMSKDNRRVEVTNISS